MIPLKAHFAYGEQANNPMPHHWGENMEAFDSLNPAWDVGLIDLASSNPDHHDLFDYSKILWSQVIRFELVLQHGGLYSDLDIKFYGPMPDFNGADLLVAVETHGSVSDAFFAAIPGHPVIEAIHNKCLKWCRSLMKRNAGGVEVIDFFNNAGVTMFSDTVREMTGLDYVYPRQVHMAQEEFGGKFHPEKGVAILPFEALCRHSSYNWLGWHQCNGTWRPKLENGKVDLDDKSWLALGA